MTETCSEIQLQVLLDHTALRLYKYVAEVVETCSEEQQQNMVLNPNEAVTDHNKLILKKNFKTVLIVTQIFFKAPLFL